MEKIFQVIYTVRGASPIIVATTYNEHLAHELADIKNKRLERGIRYKVKEYIILTDDEMDKLIIQTEDIITEMAKENALNKLTAQEKQLLGLTK